MSFKTVEQVLASALAASGTVTVAYPTGTDKGNFTGALAHTLHAIGADYVAPGDFTLTFNAGDITLTLGAGKTTIPAGETLYLQIEQKGDNDDNVNLDTVHSVVRAHVLRIDLGSPLAADTDNIIKAATGAEMPDEETVSYTPATAGTSPTDGVGPVVTIDGVPYWSMDYPRNVSLVVTHDSSVVAMTCLVTGLDEYGEDMSELLTITATGTSKTAAGKKAFKYVGQVDLIAAGDAEANTANFGFGDVLGLPFAVPVVGYVLKELKDDVAPTAGTLVGAVRSAATTTTGDVRGTYDPNDACDGALGFALIVAATDPNDLGVPQA